MTIDIEDLEQLRIYLVQQGHVPPDEPLSLHTLSGGVSNRTVWAERANGEAWVIKQALARLRVQVDWFSAPERIQREALGLTWLPRFTPPDTIPAFVFEDTANHILAMAAVPKPHANWKTLLLSGQLDLDHVRQFAQILAGIHRGSWAAQKQLDPVFRDQTFFETLRIEPYYAYTASQQPDSARFYEALIADTRAQHHAIVHGDYSPKNILVHHGRLILLDHEVIHFGDPAFDIGFSMTHLLSKAHHVVGLRAGFAEAAHVYWQLYAADVALHVDWWAGFEARAVRHVLACLLARVDGRSPLEYLTPAERDRQRAAVLALMAAPPQTIAALVAGFIERL